jgi:hypothetical protein
MIELAASHIIIDNQTPTWPIVLGACASAASAVGVLIAAFQSRRAAQASLDATRVAEEAWARTAQPHVRLATVMGTDTVPTSLQVWNRSGSPAIDVNAEVRYRDGGNPDEATRKRLETSPLPDGSYEPPWEITLSRVRADIADVIEAVVVTYADERKVGQYEQRFTPVSAQGAMAIAGYGQDRRIG